MLRIFSRPTRSNDPPRRVTWQRRVMRALNQTLSALLLALIGAFMVGQAIKWWML